MGEKIVGLGDNAHTMANTIADDVIPGIVSMRDEVALAGDAAQRSALGMDTLSNSVVAIPNEKTVVINDTSPETAERLRQLGLQVTTLPNGLVNVTANTAEGQAIIDQFINSPKSTTVTVYAVDENGNSVINNPLFGRGLGVLKAPNADGSIRQYAEGGFDGALPDQAIIQPATRGRRGLVQWAETDAGPWEAFIPGAASKRGRATNILAEVADRFGYRIFKMADGGMTDDEAARMGGGTVNASIWQAVKANNPDAVLTSAKTDHDADGGLHPKGQAIDVDPSMTNLDFLWRIRDQLAMIIFDHPEKVWYNMNGERAEGAAARSIYGEGTMAQHANHIHAGALHEVAGASAQSGPAEIQIPTLSPDSPKEDVARAIIAQGRKRGYSDDEIKAILSTGLQESGLQMATGGGGAWHGYFQQDESYPGRDDPNQNIAGFYDRLDEKRSSGGGSGDIWKDIFWLQQRPGETSAEAAVNNGRQGYLGEIMSQQNDAGALFDEIAPSVGTVAPDAAATGAPAGVQQVYVVGGKLDGAPAATSTPTESTPAATEPAPPVDNSAAFKITSPLMRGRPPIKLYAQGGIEDHQAQIARPGDYRVWAEPETEGEGYIPFAMSKRPRALRIWAEVGRRLGVKGFGEGGFGGYTVDTRDAMKPKNLNDALALLSGVGFMAASGIAPLVSMGASGKWDLGNLAPTFDSGANDIPGLSGLVGEYASQISQQLDQIVQAVREGKNITVTVESDEGPAGMILQKSGQ